MSRCTDPRFEKMLYAYELGLLSESDRRDLEVHLLECEHCFARAERFEPAARLLADDPEIRQSVISDPPPAGDKVRSSWLAAIFGRRLAPRLVPVSALAVIVLVLLLLHPWHIEIQPIQEAVAEQPRLAIMYFENLADKEDTDHWSEIAANLLITALSEAQCLRVVSAERLNDIIGNMGIAPAARIDAKTAARVAENASAKWLLTGKILRTTPRVTISTQLIDAQSGAVEASELVEGAPGQDIFSVTDTLAHRMAGHLAAPPTVCADVGRPVADITTHSFEAYQWYLQGVDYYYKKYRAESAMCFQKAIDYDSTFAMAYYYFAKVANPAFIDKAVRYADRAGYKEQLYIRSLKAQLAGNDSGYVAALRAILDRYPDEKEAVLLLGVRDFQRGDQRGAIDCFQRAITIDNRYKDAYNRLAYAYNAAGMYDSALTVLDAYIKIAPDEPNPYDSRAEILGLHGDLDGAIASLQRALEIEPRFDPSQTRLGYMYMFAGRYAEADSCFRRLFTGYKQVVMAPSHLDLVKLFMYQGKFDHALIMVDSAASAIKALYQGNLPAEYTRLLQYMKAGISIMKHNDEQAAQDIGLAAAESDLTSPYPEIAARIDLLVLCHKYDRAEWIARRFRNALEHGGAGVQWYWQAMGALETARGNGEAAIDYLQKAEATLKGQFDFRTDYLLGQAFLRFGRPQDAAPIFEKQISRYSADRANNPIDAVMIHFHLAAAYEQTRQYSQAIAQYETFLNIWKDADGGIAEIAEAAARLQALKEKVGVPHPPRRALGDGRFSAARYLRSSQ